MRLEWAVAFVLVLLLATGIELVGTRAHFRIAGRDGHNVEQTRFSGLESTAVSPTSRDVANRVFPGAPTNDSSDNSAPSHTRCEDGFFQGAFAAFMQGEGEIFGDLIGVRDADLKRHLWDRRAEDVLADVARGTMEVAPDVLAAAPGLIANATSQWDMDSATQAGSDLLRMMFFDSIDAGKRLAIDGWQGGGVMIAAVRTGDCVAFGQTLRSGVNNVPETALVLLDVVPMALAATKLGKGALALGKAAALARGAAALKRATSMGAKAARLANVALARGTVAAKSLVEMTAAAATGATGRPVLATAARAAKATGLGPSVALASFGWTHVAAAATSALAPRHLLHTAQEAFARRGAAIASAKTTLAAATHATIEGASTGTNHVAHTLHERMSGSSNVAPTSAGDLAEHLRNSAGSRLPWESGLLLGAVRTPREILHRWPDLRRIPSHLMLFVWDLAQANRRNLDEVLGRANQTARMPGAIEGEGLGGNLLLGALWRHHGKLLFDRRFSKSARLSAPGTNVVAPGASAFTDPPDSFWMGRSDWLAHGQDLRKIDPAAHHLLQQVLSWTPGKPDPSADAARIVRAAALGESPPPSDAARVMREISLGSFMSNQAEGPAPAFITERLGELSPFLYALDAVRTEFDNAARTVDIAYIARNRELFFAGTPVRPELVALVTERPMAFHLVDDAGISRLLPGNTAAERSLRQGFVHQARAENYLSRTNQNFVEDLRVSGVRIEVYARAVQGQDGINTGARYLPWLDEDDEGLVLQLIEVTKVGSREQLPFASSASPTRRFLVVRPGEVVLDGLPTDDASLDAIIQFHQFLNTQMRRFDDFGPTPPRSSPPRP